MLREIGSNFWITPNDLLADGNCSPSLFGCNGKDFTWISTGRSALSFVLKEIDCQDLVRERAALIPSFTCHTVIEPFLAAGYKVYFYSVDKSLQLDDRFLPDIAEHSDISVVLVHNYFGFNTLSKYEKNIDILRQQGIFVIEDRTQCLYSSFPPLPANYLVGSIRKWGGMPDGGFAVCRDGYFSEKPTKPDFELEVAKTTAAIAKYKFLFENTGDKPHFLDLYQKAETILDQQSGYYAIAPLSLRMQATLNVKKLRHKRRKNYQVLIDGLKDVSGVSPLFLILPEDVIPLYFPLWVEGDRNTLQAWLQDAHIYAPVVWPRPNAIPMICKDAENLYEHLLCLPIDQRYNPKDMNRIVERIKEMKPTKGIT